MCSIADSSIKETSKMFETTEPTDGSYTGILPRPAGQLHDFPVSVRWEVTRRHPYYLAFWQNALLYRQNILGDDPAQALLRHAALFMLGAIGVTGKPVNPEVSFEHLLEGDCDPAFMSGSVQPMSFRSVVAMLINGLPPAERAVVGSLLVTGGDAEYAVAGDDLDGPFQKRRALGHLACLNSPALDSFPEIPLFYVHLGASQRSIVRDMEDQVHRWKKRRKLGSAQIHTGKLSNYLSIWDLREGWTGGGYDRSSELTFAEIGRKLEIKALSTVSNRYRSAFQMITGYEFSPEIWWSLFGPLKYSELFGTPDRILSARTRRRLSSPVPRPVPDSVVSPQRDDTRPIGTVDRGSFVDDDIEATDLWIDLRALIDQGRSDEEISELLEIGDPKAVAEFRTWER